MGSLSPEAKKKRAQTMEWVYELFPRMKERRAGRRDDERREQQMAAIGRGLMALPKVLMFDEPSLGLSRSSSRRSRDRETDQPGGVTVMLVEQNVRHVAMCDRAYVLEERPGRLEGTGKDLMADPHVKEAYLGI